MFLIMGMALLTGCGQISESAPPVSPEAVKNAPNAKGEEAPVAGAPKASTFPGQTAPLEPGTKIKSK